MKANDKIPADEMLLAEAIAAAKARGMLWCEGAVFMDDNGAIPLGAPDAAERAGACCALGALYLAGRVTRTGVINANDFATGPFGYVPSGNDDSRWTEHDDGEPDLGESLGWAFRCAMTEDP